VIPALALLWGVLVSLPCVAIAQHAEVSARMRRPPGSPAPLGRLRAWLGRLRRLPPVAMFARVAAVPAGRSRDRRRDDRLARELATGVDLIAVAVAAGCNPYLAVELGARWSPPLVAEALGRIMLACRLGESFDDAMSDAARRSPRLLPLTTTLRTSARLGSPAAPALARVASEVRADLRRRAEARARTVPVRLCFPLVGCVLPAFALLTVAPVVLGGLRR
jgi:Flp pilus assembly protein TadB